MSINTSFILLTITQAPGFFREDTKRNRWFRGSMGRQPATCRMLCSSTTSLPWPWRAFLVYWISSALCTGVVLISLTVKAEIRERRQGLPSLALWRMEQPIKGRIHGSLLHICLGPRVLAQWEIANVIRCHDRRPYHNDTYLVKLLDIKHVFSLVTDGCLFDQCCIYASRIWMFLFITPFPFYACQTRQLLCILIYRGKIECV